VAGFVLKYRLARGKDSTYTVEGTALSDTQRAIRLVRSRAAEWGDDGQARSADPVERESSKPSFQALRLSKETPPAFLAFGENDRQDISQGLPELYLAPKRAGAIAELHV
jgi:hypothetical protein